MIWSWENGADRNPKACFFFGGIPVQLASSPRDAKLAGQQLVAGSLLDSVHLKQNQLGPHFCGELFQFFE